MDPYDRVVTFFSGGFFGFGKEGDFRYGSLAHIAPIFITLVVICLIWKYRNELRNFKYEEELRFIFAAILLIIEMSFFWRLFYVGPYEGKPSFMSNLPLQVCQWTLIITSFMIMKKSQLLFSISYCYCLTWNIFAICTPAVISTTGPGYYRYYQFWGEHLLPIIGMFYMLFVHKFRVKPCYLILPLGLVEVMGVLAVKLNTTFPYANYLYMAANTDEPSFANLFPENYYIRFVIYTIVSIIVQTVVYIPMYFQVRKERG